MTAHKRYTNKQKTKFSWGYWVTVPSNEFDAHGNPKRKQVTKFGYPTKKEALKAEKEFLDNLKSNKLELNKNATFNDIMQFYFDYAEKEGNYAKGTIANYKGLNNRYLSTFHNIRVDKLTSNIIRAWRKSLSEKDVSENTINDAIKLLKASFNYAKSENQITCNPFENLKKISIPQKLRKRFSPEELKKILKYCKENIKDYYCIFVLSCMTGMRVGEYSALTINDIVFENKKIYIEKQYTRGELKNRNKTNKSTRIVHASDMVLNILKWHIKEYGIEEGFLFKDAKGNPVSSKWVSRRFQKLLKASGYPENFCRVHDLRGQYVDIMHYLGISTEYIAR